MATTTSRPGDGIFPGLSLHNLFAASIRTVWNVSGKPPAGKYWMKAIRGSLHALQSPAARRDPIHLGMQRSPLTLSAAVYNAAAAGGRPGGLMVWLRGLERRWCHAGPSHRVDRSRAQSPTRTRTRRLHPQALGVPGRVILLKRRARVHPSSSGLETGFASSDSLVRKASKRAVQCKTPIGVAPEPVFFVHCRSIILEPRSWSARPELSPHSRRVICPQHQRAGAALLASAIKAIAARPEPTSLSRPHCPDQTMILAAH
jgi:hypothetical protein